MFADRAIKTFETLMQTRLYCTLRSTVIIYLFNYLFNFANKHLQGEHTKIIYRKFDRKHATAFAIYSGPYRKVRQTVNSDIRYINLN